MRLSAIVVVVLRLFALYWGASFLFGILGLMGLVNLSLMSGGSAVERLLGFLPFLVPGGYLALALITWIFASRIAAKVSGDIDVTFDVSPIGPAELYTAAILVTGLHFFLSYLGGTVGWLYYLAANNAGDDLLKGRQGLSLYDVSQQLLPCAGGIYLVVFSRKFGRRIAAQGVSAEPLAGAPAGGDGS